MGGEWWGGGGMEGKQEGQEEGTAIETQVMSPWIPVTKRLEGLRDPTQRGWERASLGEASSPQTCLCDSLSNYEAVI